MRRRQLGALCSGVCILALLAPPAAAEQAPPAVGAPFSSVGYGETPLRGHAARADFFFRLPPGTRPVGESLVELDVSHSTLLVPRSTLTITAGGVSVASTSLTTENASHARVSVRVPAELIGDAGLALSARGYLRLTDDSCEDPSNPALWATIHTTSSVQLGTEPTVRSLADAPALFTESSQGAIQIGLPSSPDPDLLRSAGVVAAQVGQWQGRQRRDPVIALAGSTEAHGPSLILAPGPGTPAGFPVSWDGSGYELAAGTGEPGTRGVLALAQEGPPRLLVGGATAAAVAEAAGALAGPTGAAGGPVAVLSGEPSAAVTPDASPWQTGAASLAQLGIAAQEVGGPGAHEISLQIDRPPGWEITGRPRLDLVVDSAATLDGDRSSVQVQLAGADLGSRRLGSGGGPRTYGFDIPPGLIDRRLDGRAVRSLDLTVRFLLELPHERCQPDAADGARAAVLPTSAFRLPHADFEGRELGRFPHPVVARDTGPAVVVLPRSPDRETLLAGLQLCAGLGRFSEPGTPPPLLTTADQVDTSWARGRGLILLGDADDQVLGRPIDLGRNPITAAPGLTSAVAGVVPSPLRNRRSVLVAHGDGAGLLLVARTLSSRQGLAGLRGSRVAVTGASPATTLADIGRPTPPAELAPVVGGASFVSRNSWAVPAVVLLAGFLIALFLLARFRWKVTRPADP